MAAGVGAEFDAPQAGRATTTVPAAARLLGIDVRTVRAMIMRRELPGGAVAGQRRLRWFVYADALMARVNNTDEDWAAARRSPVITRAASLLLQAHAELQAGLHRDSDGLGYLGRVREELTAHEEAVRRSFNHVQAALALIGDESSASEGTQTPR